MKCTTRAQCHPESDKTEDDNSPGPPPWHPTQRRALCTPPAPPSEAAAWTSLAQHEPQHCTTRSPRNPHCTGPDDRSQTTAAAPKSEAAARRTSPTIPEGHDDRVDELTARMVQDCHLCDASHNPSPAGASRHVNLRPLPWHTTTVRAIVLTSGAQAGRSRSISAWREAGREELDADKSQVVNGRSKP